MSLVNDTEQEKTGSPIELGASGTFSAFDMLAPGQVFKKDEKASEHHDKFAALARCQPEIVFGNEDDEKLRAAQALVERNDFRVWRLPQEPPKKTKTQLVLIDNSELCPFAEEIVLADQATVAKSDGEEESEEETIMKGRAIVHSEPPTKKPRVDWAKQRPYSGNKSVVKLCRHFGKSPAVVERIRQEDKEAVEEASSESETESESESENEEKKEIEKKVAELKHKMTWELLQLRAIDAKRAERKAFETGVALKAPRFSWTPQPEETKAPVKSKKSKTNTGTKKPESKPKKKNNSTKRKRASGSRRVNRMLSTENAGEYWTVTQSRRKKN